jgi:hypothetical protein
MPLNDRGISDYHRHRILIHRTGRINWGQII